MNSYCDMISEHECSELISADDGKWVQRHDHRVLTSQTGNSSKYVSFIVAETCKTHVARCHNYTVQGSRFIDDSIASWIYAESSGPLVCSMYAKERDDGR